MDLAHTKTVEEVLQEFKVTEEEGLDNACVEEQRRKHGLNGETVVKQEWHVCVCGFFSYVHCEVWFDGVFNPYQTQELPHNRCAIWRVSTFIIIMLVYYYTIWIVIGNIFVIAT